MKHRNLRFDCKQTAGRQGAIAVIALIAILITVSIGMGLVRTSLQSREQTRRWQQQTQARWLAEAGVERAAAQLAQSSDYHGETWKLSAEELGGRRDGEVRIDLEPVDENSRIYRVTVVADYPAESEQRIRSRKTVTIAKPDSPDGDNP